MIFLADTSDPLEKVKADLRGMDVGQLVTPLTKRSNLGTTWAMDNGAFSRFDEKTYLRLLRRDATHRERCLFVVLPDVVACANQTTAQFHDWKDRPELRGWPRAYAAQDGIDGVQIPWDDFSCLFIGGSTRFKTSWRAYQIAKAAKELGKRVHVGRVNSRERFDAWEWADSCDGTGVARYTHMRKSMTSGTPLFHERRTNEPAT